MCEVIRVNVDIYGCVGTTNISAVKLLFGDLNSNGLKWGGWHASNIS